MSFTLDYYNNNAANFTAGTKDVEFTAIQDNFIKRLKQGAKILDFGCGSGRDTKYFLGKGYDVDATDGSEELCKIAGEYAGVQVKQMLFEELDAVEEYDGVWACASILHVRPNPIQSGRLFPMGFPHKLLIAFSKRLISSKIPFR